MSKHETTYVKENAILVMNAGSSSIKFAIFAVKSAIKSNSNQLIKINHGLIDKINLSPELTIYDIDRKTIVHEKLNLTDYEKIVAYLISLINNLLVNFNLIAVGHRVVHGGHNYLNPILINDKVIEGLHKLIPLAPLHQPYNLKLIITIKKLDPKLLQVACFDTAFHATQQLLARRFAIPKELLDEGIVKYGFHGLSYEYIAKALPKHFPMNVTQGKIVVAHLGNGASCCALNNLQSVATSMGFTALEGFMMGTRCGNIDPGVLLYLLEEKKLTIKETTKLLYSGSGLLGVSGISSDVRELEASSDLRAKEALELFCYRAAREIIAVCTMLRGLDGIVFTAGIGEHSSFVRSKICDWLSWLGVKLDLQANQDFQVQSSKQCSQFFKKNQYEQTNQGNSQIISAVDSKVIVGVIPTNEELMIAEHTMYLAKV